MVYFHNLKKIQFSRWRLLLYQLIYAINKYFLWVFFQIIDFELLEMTSDELLKAMGLKGGQIIRLRKGVAAFKEPSQVKLYRTFIIQ